MKKISLFILAFMAVLAATSHAFAAEPACTAADAQAADAAYPAHSWKELRKQFDLYGKCDDGGIAEGFSDDVVNLLADHWPDIGDLEKEVENDSDFFYEFVLRHIDGTADTEKLGQIALNAQNRCPPNLGTLCHTIEMTSTLTTPPQLPVNIFERIKGTTGERLAVNFRLGKFAGSFESTTFSDVQKIVGEGSLQHMGDAGESLYWLCYTIKDRKHPQRIWLTGGELSGGKYISGLDISEVDPETKSEELCPALPAKLRPINIDNNIHLGMSRQQLIDKLGKPSKEEGHWLVYNHEGKTKNGYDEIGSFVVFIQDDRVERLQANKTTTN